MYGVVLILVLLIMGGAIAYIGDKLGSKIGKKRMSVFGLRPKYTSILMTIITGILISLFTLGTMTVVSKNVRTALFGMEKLQSELTNLNKEVQTKTVESNLVRQELSEKNKAIIDLDGQINDAAIRLEKIAKERDALQLERAKMQGDLSSIQEEMQAIEQSYQQAQIAVEELTRAKDRSQEELKELEGIAEQMARNITKVREGQIIFQAGEVVYSNVIRSNGNNKNVREQVFNMLQLANTGVLRSLGVAENADFNKQVLWISKYDIEDILSFLDKEKGEFFVRIVAAGNIVYGEPIVSTFVILPNEKIYERDQSIYSHKIQLNNNQNPQVLIQEFFFALNEKATKDGVIADPLQRTVGSVSMENVQRMQDALTSGKEVTFVAKAKNDTYTADALAIYVEIKIKGEL